MYLIIDFVKYVSYPLLFRAYINMYVVFLTLNMDCKTIEYDIETMSRHRQFHFYYVTL